MRTLKELDAVAAKLQDLPASGLSASRMRRETDRLTWSIYEILRPSIRKQVSRKGMRDFEDDIQQHSLIAINFAVANWDPERSSFSTFVHWKLMAELRTLELHLFPSRRALAKDLDIKQFSIDASVYDDPDGRDFTELNDLNPEAEASIDDNAEKALLYRRMDEIFAQMISQRVSQFEAGGCVQPRTILNGMRDIHIFILRELQEVCANDVAVIYDLTRERIRQITASTQAQFNKIGSVPGGVDITDDCARQWNLAVALYKEHAEIDVRLSETAELQPSNTYERIPALPALPPVEFAEAAQAANDVADTEIVEDLAFAKAEQQELDLPAETSDANVVRPNFLQRARSAFMAGERKASTRRPEQNVLPFRAKAKAATIAAAAMAALASQGVAAKALPVSPPAVSDQSYAVKLDVHGDKGEIRIAAPAERAKHAEFSDLQIAYVPGAIERESSLAFAPLAWLDAQRICSDMTAIGEKCSIIRIRRGSG